jgi:hypothetical protein
MHSAAACSAGMRWRQHQQAQSDLTRKKEFGILFDEFARIRDGIVGTT